MLNCSL